MAVLVRFSILCYDGTKQRGRAGGYKMENLIWLIIMIPCSAILTGIGIYAWHREKPMWFWTGSEVKASEIADIPAYNRANGRMWIVYSLIFWAAAFAGLWSGTLAVVLIVVGCALGLPAMLGRYKRIYKKYKG